MKGRRILLGVTGGIAAYKAADLCSKLVQAGAEVTVVMTDSARRFVAPLTFETLSRRSVYTDMWSADREFNPTHIALADWAEIVVVAPAMNVRMWQNRVVQDNVRRLRELGHTLVEPGEGYLACGTVGVGRLAEVQDILNAVAERLK